MPFVPGSSGEPRWLRATHLIDRAYVALGALRDELALAYVPAETWTAVVRQRYAGQVDLYCDPTYRANRLWPWEESAVLAFFPRPPARVLVGGAGAGREMIALAERGYAVAGFDPSPPLFGALGEHLRQAGLEAPIALAGYEDLIRALGEPGAAAPHGVPAGFWQEGGFEAVLLGFGSFSYVVEPAARLGLLQGLARLCPGGPVLMSFEEQEETRGRLARCVRLVRAVLRHAPGSRALDAGDRLGGCGFEHAFTAGEIEALASAAGYRVGRFASRPYPHAVLLRAQLEAKAAGPERRPPGPRPRAASSRSTASTAERSGRKRSR